MNIEQEINDLNDLINEAIKTQNLLLIQRNIDLIESIEINFEQQFKLRKKYGAFYTNKEISRFIFVRTLILYLKKEIKGLEINTIDEIFGLTQHFQNKIYNKLLTIKVCDPACGLGSFIISALEIILSLITKLNNDFNYHEIIPVLLKNIFGFEINQSALNICKLKLYYWAIQKIIIDLSQIHEIINANFNLKNTLFELKNPMFDIIVGNPPYGNIMGDREKRALKEQNVYHNDIYCAFLLKALQWTDGVIGFLVPKSFLLRQSYLNFRHQLLSKANLLEIFDIGPNIFKKATNEVQILILEKKIENSSDLQVFKYPNQKVISYPTQKFDNLRICLNKACPLSSMVQKIFVYTYSLVCPFCGSDTITLNRIRIKLNNAIKEIVEKIEKEADLNLLNIRDFPKMIRGEEADGLKEVRKLINHDKEGSCSFIYAKDDFQYYYYKNNKTFDLQNMSSKLLKGKNFEYYIKPKLLIKHNNIFPQAIYTEECVCFTSSIYSLIDDNKMNLKYFCGLINSSLIQFYCFYAINNQQNTTINLNQYMIRHLPLKYVVEKEKIRIARSVDLITKTFKNTKGKINKTIAKLWREIDELIFKIYSFPEEEKEYILRSMQKENEFLKRIYSAEIK